MTSPGTERWRATAEQASGLPVSESQRSVEALSDGPKVVKYYALLETEEQTPHIRDELYVMARERGHSMVPTRHIGRA